MLFLTEDKIAWAQFTKDAPPFARKGRSRRSRGRKACGARYEAKAHAHFTSLYDTSYVASPWLKFMLVGEERYRYAQPDGLYFNVLEGQITIVEMKYQHTSDSYWQLVGKYAPLMRKMFPKNLWEIAVVEVVKWYDCNVMFPTHIKLREKICDVKANEFAVHIYKPA